MFVDRQGPHKFTSNVLFLRKLTEDVLHQKRESKKQLGNRDFNMPSPPLSPVMVKGSQRTRLRQPLDEQKEGRLQEKHQKGDKGTYHNIEGFCHKT